jgi:hypothetical protein
MHILTNFCINVGYNDRGQCGLGHRINTSEFKHIEYMQGKTVLQVCEYVYMFMYMLLKCLDI